MKYWQIEKGLSIIGVVILVTVVVLGIFGVRSLANKKISQGENFNLQEVSKQNPLKDETGDQTDNGQTTIQSNKKSCNEDTNICLEKEELTINIIQGYREQEDYWVGDQFKIVGKGSNGYKLSLSSDFPKGIKLSRPESTFDDNTNMLIFVMMQKNVVEPGVYSGKLTLLDKSLGIKQEISLVINYKKWSKEAIHVDPAEIIEELEYDRQNGNVKIVSQNYSYHLPIKLYYFGRHTVQLKTVYEKSAPRGYRAKFSPDNSTEKTIDDVARVVFNYSECYIQNDGCPSIPDGLYTGYFQFLDKDTKEEILRIPYQITISSKKD